MSSQKFISEEPLVKLEATIRDPYDLAVATARTCYSSQGIIRVEDVRKDERAKQLRDKIAQSTRDAGHLTTRQHAHFVFSLQKVSRHFVWSFLHSHPFYNSEQVSQRYVKVKAENWAVPPLEEKPRTIYEQAVREQTVDYQRLIDLLLPYVGEAYYSIFPIRRKWEDKYKSTVAKKAYELARYVLPVATHSYLYHTVSAVTLLRYQRLVNLFDTSLEQKIVVQKMLEEVLKVDPEFGKDFSEAYPLEETPEWKMLNQFGKGLSSSSLDGQEALPLSLEGRGQGEGANTRQFIREFDVSLEGHVSKLVDYKVHAQATVAQSVREVFGLTKAQMSDEVALDQLLDPSKNPYLAETLNVNTLSKLSRCMVHAHYTFRKKISHSADSQDQRHRMTPASRPILETHYTGEPDYIVPKLIAGRPEVLDLYQRSMEKAFRAINRLLEEGVKAEFALYLLPNAFPIRFEESGDLLNLHHKWHTRACYTAQDEIFYATIDEIVQVKELHPALASKILAPCYIRKHAGLKPVCPEGERFCGTKVWEKEIGEYERVL
ncbi:MAG: FAD-dependent thymidylate synthase [Deltaproteobacteria bacterium]|nr:FAD-dependent thymidylate synthase [Deltaproteobacteria bacterium]